MIGVAPAVRRGLRGDRRGAGSGGGGRGRVRLEPGRADGTAVGALVDDCRRAEAGGSSLASAESVCDATLGGALRRWSRRESVPHSWAIRRGSVSPGPGSCRRGTAGEASWGGRAGQRHVEAGGGGRRRGVVRDGGVRLSVTASRTGLRRRVAPGRGERVPGPVRGSGDGGAWPWGVPAIGIDARRAETRLGRGSVRSTRARPEGIARFPQGRKRTKQVTDGR